MTQHMLKFWGHCLEGMFKVFLMSDKFDHLEGLGHCRMERSLTNYKN